MNRENLPPIVRLKYKPGETIIKGGDFGISIYQIVDGKVEVFIESGEQEICLSHLGPGEIIGEMIFLTGNQAQRSASARAVEYTVLEAWHPTLISQEFSELPVLLKSIAGQLVRRLKRMNHVVGELEAVKIRGGKEKKTSTDPWAAHRAFYRKSVSIECMYRPSAAHRKTLLWGKIKDISKTGMRLEVKTENTLTWPHEAGEDFSASAFLPSGKRLDVTAKIVRQYELAAKGTCELGMKFVNLSQHASELLGFFLMP
ncbi:MAG: cyclic nucleotide-binding domain-containing protein [Desulfobacterales bacterium]